MSTWAGGTTTELAIFPAGSSYARRDFAWRVSSATVTVPTSAFTRLEGYRRRLMVLDGELRLRPATGAEVELGAGDQYRFDGATLITCFGLATDFNLMLTHGLRGRLTRLVIGPGGRGRWRPDPHAAHGLAYCHKGQAKISSAYIPCHIIGPGDLVWATDDAADPGLPSLKMESAGAEPLVMVLVTVFNTP